MAKQQNYNGDTTINKTCIVKPTMFINTSYSHVTRKCILPVAVYCLRKKKQITQQTNLKK